MTRPGGDRLLKSSEPARESAQHAIVADAPPPQAQIQVYLLGGFRVLVNGRPLGEDVWHRKKARQLFKLLLTRPKHASSKDELIELLWPDSDPDTGSTNLRSTMHALRRALDLPEAPLGAATLAADRASVRLASDSTIWVDADEFERLVEQARNADDPVELLQRADDLYVGHYLPEDAYEDWAGERRARLKRSAADVRFELARYWEGRGALETATGCLRSLLEADACDERAGRELMRLLSAQGRRSEAVRVYQALVRALRDDLDVEPSDLTIVLFETELAHARAEANSARPDASQATRPAHHLPAQPGIFVGRDTELATALRQIRRKDVRLLTFVGPGGCGKTRLALEVGAALRGDFKNGIWFVDLSAVRDPDQILFAIGRTLGINQPAYGQSYFERLSEAIAADELLLILDNCEQVVNGAIRVAELLGACPHLKILATSREPLHLRWEHEFDLAPLVGPPVSPDAAFVEIAAAPAVALFVHRAQAIKQDWRLNAKNAAEVAQLCLRLDCLPLAIELAAARIKLFTPSAMLTRLDQHIDLLNTAARDLPERHQGLRLAIAWSQRLLSSDEQHLFQRLAVFSGGFTVKAASTVCTDPPATDARLLPMLQALVDKSLLRVELQPDSEPRFTMLETIRDFGLAELTRTGELASQQRRHAEWCVQLAEQADAELTGSAQSAWLDEVEREHANMRTALRWCFEGGDAQLGVRLTVGLANFWEIRGYLQEAHQWFKQEQALGLGESVADPLRARLCNAAGHVAFLRGEDHEARMLLEESVHLSRKAAVTPLVLQGLINLARVAMTERDDAHATDLLEECRQIATADGDRSCLGLSLNLLGEIAFNAQRFAQARMLLEQSLKVRRSEGNQWGTAKALSDLGAVLREQGSPDKARALHAEALAIWRELADSWGIAYALEDLAVLLGAGRSELAARLLAAATTARQRIGIRTLPARESRLLATQQICASVLGAEAFASAWSQGCKANLGAVALEVQTLVQ